MNQKEVKGLRAECPPEFSLLLMDHLEPLFAPVIALGIQLL
jgi:hypothetical protein